MLAFPWKKPQNEYLNLSFRNHPKSKAPKSKLKGPKHEIFEHGVFAQIRPVRERDLATRQKN